MTETSLQSNLTLHQQAVAGLDAPGILAWAADAFPGGITFASSLGAEDQVILHLIATAGLPIEIFTLDTGRLFQETYDLIARSEERYGVRIRIMFPDRAAVEEMVTAHGVNLFYNSVELRRACCGVRKMEPLRRALAGRHAWVTGLRRDQSVTRTELEPVEWDSANGLFKVNPLHDWSQEQVWDFVRLHDIPYNPLHDKGFLSIGCASCTRAVQPGEDIRAGRWWWESADKKECGLHFKDGKLVRGSAQ